MKPASKVVWRHVERKLTDFLGAGRSVRSITESDAEAFRLYLVGEKLAPTTVAKRLQFARQFFRTMLKRKLIDSNPFADVRHQGGDCSERQFFINRVNTAKLIDAAPDWTWRAIIALVRFGGLRSPSETLSLRWADVDWEKARLRVISPKTEHHAGKASRMVPMFPELQPYLEEAWDAGPRAKSTLSRQATARQPKAPRAGEAATCEPSLAGL